MKDHNDTTRKLESALEKFEEGVRTLSGGPMSYYMEKIQTYVEALFTKYAPFRVGDRVELTQRPKSCRPDTRWWDLRDKLVAGVVGDVEEVDYHDGQFWADVVWDIGFGPCRFHIEEASLRKVASSSAA